MSSFRTAFREETAEHGRRHAQWGAVSSMSRSMSRGPQRRRANTDTVKLLMLGYRQDLAREFTLFNCFGSSFTALSCLTALAGTYGSIGMTYGGPVVMVWGWLLVLLFTTSVGLSMAELASAYPTSGALYYWCFKLAPRRSRVLVSWMSAWILTLGQAAFAASNIYTFVIVVSSAIRVQYGLELSAGARFGLLLGTLIAVGLLNCGSSRLTAFMITLGTMWHIVALAAFCIALPLMAPDLNTAKYVFTSWQQNADVTGIDSPAYTVLVGLLMAQWTLTGYDGAAHVAEETLSAEVNVPRAILLCIGGVGLTGYAVVLSLTFVRLDVAALFDPGNETGGASVMLQILVEVSKAAYGSTGGGVALFTIPMVAVFFCSYQSIANNSRMLYAMARDNGVPFAAYAKGLHPRTRAPVYSVLYMLLLAGLLSAPMCFNEFIFPAITSFAVVACYVAYALPVACKLWTRRRYFLPGPFYLGPLASFVNNCITLAWVGTVTVLFTLPQFYPVTPRNMNWSGPLLGLALVLALACYYFPRHGARNWFIGPITNLGQFKDVLPSDMARAAAALEAAEEAAAAAAAAAERAAADADLLLQRIKHGDCGGGGGSSVASGVANVTIRAGTGGGGGGGGGGKGAGRYARLSSGKCTPRGASPAVTASGYVFATAAVSVTAAARSVGARASGSGSGLRFVDAGGSSMSGRAGLRGGSGTAAAGPGSPLRLRRGAAVGGGGGGRARRHSMFSLHNAAAAVQAARLLRRGASGAGPGPEEPGSGADDGQVRRSFDGGERIGARAEAAARRMSAVPAASVADRPLFEGREVAPRRVGDGSMPYSPAASTRGRAVAAASAAVPWRAGGSGAGNPEQPRLLALGCAPRQLPVQARHALLRVAGPEGTVLPAALSPAGAASGARARSGVIGGNDFLPSSLQAARDRGRRASVSVYVAARDSELARRLADAADAAAAAADDADDADLTLDGPSGGEHPSGGEDRASARARMRRASVSVVTIVLPHGHAGRRAARHAAARGAVDVCDGVAAVAAAPPRLLDPLPAQVAPGRRPQLAYTGSAAGGAAVVACSGDDEGSSSGDGGGGSGGRSSLDAMLQQRSAARVSGVLASSPHSGTALAQGAGRAAGSRNSGGSVQLAAAGGVQGQALGLRPAGMGGG